MSAQLLIRAGSDQSPQDLRVREVNSIDIKNLGTVYGPVFGPKLRPILVLYFQFYISGRFSGTNLCQLN